MIWSSSGEAGVAQGSSPHSARTCWRQEDLRARNSRALRHTLVAYVNHSRQLAILAQVGESMAVVAGAMMAAGSSSAACRREMRRRQPAPNHTQTQAGHLRPTLYYSLSPFTRRVQGEAAAAAALIELAAYGDGCRATSAHMQARASSVWDPNASMQAKALCY